MLHQSLRSDGVYKGEGTGCLTMQPGARRKGEMRGSSWRLSCEFSTDTLGNFTERD